MASLHRLLHRPVDLAALAGHVRLPYSSGVTLSLHIPSLLTKRNSLLLLTIGVRLYQSHNLAAALNESPKSDETGVHVRSSGFGVYPRHIWPRRRAHNQIRSNECVRVGTGLDLWRSLLDDSGPTDRQCDTQIELCRNTGEFPDRIRARRGWRSRYFPQLRDNHRQWHGLNALSAIRWNQC